MSKLTTGVLSAKYRAEVSSMIAGGQNGIVMQDYTQKHDPENHHNIPTRCKEPKTPVQGNNKFIYNIGFNRLVQIHNSLRLAKRIPEHITFKQNLTTKRIYFSTLLTKVCDEIDKTGIPFVV